MPESIRYFALCSAMEWSHLPNPGGIYEQDPEFLDDITTMFILRAQHEEEERDKRERGDRKKLVLPNGY